MDEMVEMDRPLCGCHDEPMTLRNDRSVGWRCTVKNRAAQMTYNRTTKGMKRMWEADRRRQYGQT